MSISYAGKILGSLLNGLSDRNITVRKAYASAIGHVVKVAKDSSIEKLISRLRDWYLEKEGMHTLFFFLISCYLEGVHMFDV